ncbi:MAG: hypothetical protein GX895_05515 [Clostridiales bacterium]|uniref:hypothetical protein n=1 Tax=Clostridium sp. N3C TaxID=1776758 RepID=UPI00092E1568|nr:hypothetical protein [Clostridium sp. N3C]NLZ48239.1 hypothetical protein [Clostridiales bacterium]SCN22264.1 hypothetical protein N3C_0671 [Clostridium sp. N3C]
MSKRKEYAVILVENEDTCSIKKVSQNSFNQIKDMKSRGKDDPSIVKSIVELNTREDNIISNGLTKQEAIEQADKIGCDFLSLETN